MENVENNTEKKYPESRFRQEIFSKVIRAGKRTYFFDVKSTRANEYYLTITESKKKFLDNGKFQFEKHKLFLYKEDFDKFAGGLQEIIDYIRENQPELTPRESVEKVSEKPESEKVVEQKEPEKDFTSVDFDEI